MNIGAGIDQNRVKLKKLKVCLSIEGQNAQIRTKDQNEKGGQLKG
jgi:hypothetical protein